MRTMERGRRKIFLAVLLISVLFCAHSQASILYTRLIRTSFFGGGEWYDNTNSRIDLSGSVVLPDAALYIHGLEGEPFLDMTNVTFNFVAEKEREYSSGNLAKAYFQGSVPVEITGTLVHDTLGSVYTGVIFKAELTPVYEDQSQNPSVDCWAFEEHSDNNGYFDRTLENMQMVIDPGGNDGLSSGIEIGDDILMMTGPKMDFSLKSNPNPVAYNTNLVHFMFGSNIQITGEVPEPVSLLLLAFGGLVVSRVKK